MIGLDTTALIDLFKNKKEILELLDKVDEKIFLNEISYLELMFGLNPENLKHKEEERFYDDLYMNFESFPLNRVSCKKAAEIFWHHQHIGKSVGKFDSMAASIFLSNGVDKIITRNVKHFENIKGLKVIPY
ncbi:type II toxin-antitoxin system VapC family toxin [Candidatus Pacearchaeota archaeon]|nr:type II toxin-antitoxin system VapC family toxin [Candidatus Pacearchaeota archaeon]